MSVRVGVIVFPGSNRDVDALNALATAGAEPVRLWHEQATLDGAGAIIVPGGFAYGDYLRAGAIARFSPIMRAVAAFAAEGGLVLGICNGFQVLAEAGLVPGALLRNRGLRFVSREVRIVPERLDTPFTAACDGRPMRMPVAHGEGCFYADDASLAALEAGGQVLFRYARADGSRAGGEDDRANPNGSLHAIAGVSNGAGNVGGLMPHPEAAVDAVTGSDEGLPIIRSLVEAATVRAAAAGPVPVGGTVR
jgi:phosphoribosylformylglycinamidine synthase